MYRLSMFTNVKLNCMHTRLQYIRASLANVPHNGTHSKLNMNS